MYFQPKFSHNSNKKKQTTNYGRKSLEKKVKRQMNEKYIYQIKSISLRLLRIMDQNPQLSYSAKVGSYGPDFSCLAGINLLRVGIFLHTSGMITLIALRTMDIGACRG